MSGGGGGGGGDGGTTGGPAGDPSGNAGASDGGTTGGPAGDPNGNVGAPGPGGYGGGGEFGAFGSGFNGLGLGDADAFGDAFGGQGFTSTDPTTENSIISFALPFPVNAVYAVLSSFDKGLANFAQPAPDDPGPMGGPGDGFLQQLYPRPPAPPGPQPFQINPMQVQNDMRGGWGNQGQGGWGGGYQQQPAMNQFSMYGSGSSPMAPMANPFGSFHSSGSPGWSLPQQGGLFGGMQNAKMGARPANASDFGGTGLGGLLGSGGK